MRTLRSLLNHVLTKGRSMSTRTYRVRDRFFLSCFDSLSTLMNLWLTVRLHNKKAVEQLNTLQSNAAALGAIRASGASNMAEYAVPEMIGFLDRIGYRVSKLFWRVSFVPQHSPFRCSRWTHRRKILINSTLYMLPGRRRKCLPPLSHTLYYDILFHLGKSVWVGRRT